MNTKNKRILSNWQEFGNEQTAEAYFALLEACKRAEAWLNDLRREPCKGEHRAKLISRETDALHALRQAIKDASN